MAWDHRLNGPGDWYYVDGTRARMKASHGHTCYGAIWAFTSLVPVRAQIDTLRTTPFPNSVTLPEVRSANLSNRVRTWTAPGVWVWVWGAGRTEPQWGFKFRFSGVGWVNLTREQHGWVLKRDQRLG